MRANRLGFGALLVVIVYCAAAFLGGYADRADPNEPSPLYILKAPSWSHPFGTDELGRDALSRVVAGDRVAVVVAAVAIAIAFVAGLIIGVVAGYAGGIVDILLTRSQDVLFAFPTLLLAIIIVGALGPSTTHAAIAIGVVYIPRFARVARSASLTIRSAEYLDASRLAGTPGWRICWRHVVPNALPVVIVLAALSTANAELAYATLSFLGLGARPPQADWGSMLSTASNFMTIAPWLIVGPAIALVVLLVCLNILGDVLRDILDPHMHAVREVGAEGVQISQSET